MSGRILSVLGSLRVFGVFEGLGVLWVPNGLRGLEGLEGLKIIRDIMGLRES